jgi:hypothetical protein
MLKVTKTMPEKVWNYIKKMKKVNIKAQGTQKAGERMERVQSKQKGPARI